MNLLFSLILTLFISVALAGPTPHADFRDKRQEGSLLDGMCGFYAINNALAAPVIPISPGREADGTVSVITDTKILEKFRVAMLRATAAGRVDGKPDESTPAPHDVLRITELYFFNDNELNRALTANGASNPVANLELVGQLLRENESLRNFAQEQAKIDDDGIVHPPFMLIFSSGVEFKTKNLLTGKAATMFHASGGHWIAARRDPENGHYELFDSHISQKERIIVPEALLTRIKKHEVKGLLALEPDPSDYLDDEAVEELAVKRATEAMRKIKIARQTALGCQ